MKSRNATITAVAALGFVSAHAMDHNVRGDFHGQVSFISGGVGEGSEAQILSRAKDFNLKLLFATRDGHYLASIPVTITDSGNSQVLDTVSQGPYLFADLPPGHYTITAEHAGKAQSRSVTVNRSTQREQIFRWEVPAS